MKTEEEMMQDLISYVENLAYGHSKNKECTILTGVQKNTFEGHHINNFQDILDYGWALNIAIELELERDTKDLSKSDAVKLFQYVFDKSIEIFYLEEIDARTIDLDLIIEEALDGYYELSIPEDLYIKVNSVVPKVVLLAGIVHDYMDKKGYLNLPTEDLLYPYFCVASYLAQQFLLEQDLNQSSAYANNP